MIIHLVRLTRHSLTCLQTPCLPPSFPCCANRVLYCLSFLLPATDAGITLVHVVCPAAGYPYYCPGYVGSPVMSGSDCRLCARLRLPLSH
jgi:hypothetical protein